MSKQIQKFFQNSDYYFATNLQFFSYFKILISYVLGNNPWRVRILSDKDLISNSIPVKMASERFNERMSKF